MVFALPILVAFRRTEEQLDERAAIRAVLASNLFGLEIDPRCTQIAAFALALASWKRLGGPEPLPKLNLACSGLAIGLGKAEFLRLAEKIADAEGWVGKTDLLGTERPPLGATAAARHRGELEALYDLFEKAPYLGSLIDPRRELERKFGPLYATGMDKLSSVLEWLLEKDDASAEARETAVTAHGIAKSAQVLSTTYTLVCTNVPYLTRQSQSEVIRAYVDHAYPDASADIATCMISRFDSKTESVTVSSVSPSSWLYQPAYKKFRRRLLSRGVLDLVVRLGPGAFEFDRRRGGERPFECH